MKNKTEIFIRYFMFVYSIGFIIIYPILCMVDLWYFQTSNAFPHFFYGSDIINNFLIFSILLLLICTFLLILSRYPIVK
jgi:hypothetical protein